MKLSLIIPVFNEEKNILILYDKLIDVLEKINCDYEIIFIDDGSYDNTLDNLKKIKDSNVKIISFVRNYGKAAALMKGFGIAEGDIVFTMDGDLQDDPEEIPRFIEALKNYDMVVGWKYIRKDPLSKRVPSKFFNKMIYLFSGLDIHDCNCGFKAMKKEVAKNIEIYGELHRYIPVLAFWQGYKVGEIKVKHHKRIYGKSKYGLSRLYRGLFDLFTIKFMYHFAYSPFYLFGGTGFLLGIIGFVILTYLTFLWFLGYKLSNRPLLLFGILLVVLSIQLISLGFIAELVIRNKKKEYKERKIN